MVFFSLIKAGIVTISIIIIYYITIYYVITIVIIIVVVNTIIHFLYFYFFFWGGGRGGGDSLSSESVNKEHTYSSNGLICGKIHQEHLSGLKYTLLFTSPSSGDLAFE